MKIEMIKDGDEENLEYCIDNHTKLPIASHRLNCRWTLWVNLINSNKGWAETLKEVNDVESIEDFWSLYSNCKNVEELLQVCPKFEFSFFRTGIVPMTEVPENKDGGRFVFTLEKTGNRDVDTLWLQSMVFLICECAEPIAQITGAVLALKIKLFKLSFWTRTCDPHKINMLRDVFSEMLPEVAAFPNSFSGHRSY